MDYYLDFFLPSRHHSQRKPMLAQSTARRPPFQRGRAGSELMPPMLFGNSRFSRASAKKSSSSSSSFSLRQFASARSSSLFRLFASPVEAVRSYAPIFTLSIDPPSSSRLSGQQIRPIVRTRSLMARPETVKPHSMEERGGSRRPLGEVQRPVTAQKKDIYEGMTLERPTRMENVAKYEREEGKSQSRLAVPSLAAMNHPFPVEEKEEVKEIAHTPALAKESLAQNDEARKKSEEKGPIGNKPVKNGPVENGLVENGLVENMPVENGPVENGLITDKKTGPEATSKSRKNSEEAKEVCGGKRPKHLNGELAKPEKLLAKKRRANKLLTADAGETVSLFDFDREGKPRAGLEQCEFTDILDRRHFHEHFDTDAYLRDFYARVEDPAMQLVLFHLPNLVARLGPLHSLLDFGCGPTIHVAVCFRAAVEHIFLADYLPQNRAELGRWLEGRSTFDWTHVLRIIAAREALPAVEIGQMEQQTREKVRAILHCDCLATPAIHVPSSLAQQHFGAITTFLTLEYCCLSREEYAKAIQRISALLTAGGFLIMGGVLEETWCAFGGRKFTCLFIDRPFVLNCLQAAGLRLWHDHLGTRVYYEQEGMFLLVAKKNVAHEEEDGEDSDYEN